MTSRVALAEVAAINPRMPNGLSRQDGERMVPFLSMSAVSEDGYAVHQARRPIAELLKGYTHFQRGDVLLAKITPCLENGKAALLDDLPDDFGFGSTEFHVLRPGPDIDPRYLLHAVWNNAFRQAASNSFTGSAGQKRLPASFFDRYRIPLPALGEQRRIAAVLDKADGIRRKRRESLKLLDEFLRSAFLEMFGDPVRNEKGWPTETLGQLIRVRSGDFLPASQMDSDGLYPVYGGNGPSGSHSRFMFEAPVLVIGRVGVYCGAVHLAPAQSWVTDNALYVAEHDERLEVPYLEWGLRLLDLNRVASQSSQPLISAGRIYPIQFPIPPLESQSRFAAVLKLHTQLHKHMAEASRIAGELHNSLAQRAFRGAMLAAAG